MNSIILSVVTICLLVPISATNAGLDNLFVHPVQLSEKVSIDLCDGENYHFKPPHRKLCSVIDQDPVIAEKITLEVYVHDKQSVTVRGHKCERIQFIFEADPWRLGGKSKVSKNKLKLTADECKNAAENIDPQVPIGSANFWSPKKEVFDPIIKKTPFSAVVDRYDRIILPDTLEHPLIDKREYVEHNSVYIWEGHTLQGEYKSQGVYDCYVSRSDYVCPKLKLVFHRSEFPKIISVDGKTLEKTSEGIYITTDKAPDRTDIKDDSTVEAFYNTELEYQDRQMAMITREADLIRKTLNCVNRNYLVDDIERLETLSIELTSLLFSTSSIKLLNGKRLEGIKCREVVVDRLIKDYQCPQFITTDNLKYNYDVNTRTLVNSSCVPLEDDFIAFRGVEIKDGGEVFHHYQDIKTLIRTEHKVGKPDEAESKTYYVWDKIQMRTQDPDDWLGKTWAYITSLVSDVKTALALTGLFVFVLACIYLYVNIRNPYQALKRHGPKESNSLENMAPLS